MGPAASQLDRPLSRRQPPGPRGPCHGPLATLFGLLLGLTPSLTSWAAAPAEPGAGPPASEGLTLEQCVAIALQSSGKVHEAQARVAEWRARLAEVEAVYSPKLSALAWAAPTFAVSGGALQQDVQRDYGRWGPALRVEALLARPIYTFGQVEAGARAASERLAVEQARVAQAQAAVALEVHRYYYLHLYLRSLEPTLEFARRSLEQAEKIATEQYESASGRVTTVDRMKLRYAAVELEKYRLQAEFGLPLSLAALRQTMGLVADAPLTLAASALPPLGEDEPAPLGELVRTAWERRPEAALIDHGRRAALSLEQAERLAVRPVLLLAGQLAASWSPVRDAAANPYWYDPYNDVTGGVALALKWDLDPARSAARGDGARALADQVDGLAQFAATGIPLEVRRARDEWLQARRTVALAEEGATATRKWLLFASTAHSSGTGDTRDLLEGLAAFLGAKKSQYDALLAAHQCRAQLAWATGGLAAGSLCSTGGTR